MCLIVEGTQYIVVLEILAIDLLSLVYDDSKANLHVYNYR